ncbi:hypothetical protein [Psychrobacter sp. JCM 18901]|uniref:hypothetical protein n=1 Tax=Psychrobacter sp. JCM 18901 TaxID=1298609 RepID=UPI0021C49CFC|nr:hypothetical protein [Psychrobacter sp. JCM 18901]
MYQLTRISKALTVISISSLLFMGQSIAAETTDSVNTNNSVKAPAEVSPVTNGVSQKLTGDSKAATSLNKLLPTIKYTTENLSDNAKKDKQCHLDGGCRDRS